MNIRFEINRFENEDVITTSVYYGCYNVGNVQALSAGFFVPGQSYAECVVLGSHAYEQMKAANGNKDLDTTKWYAVYVDEDFNITSIREHSEIGHSDHKYN